MEILSVVSYYSLFKKKLFDDDMMIINQLPTDSFGVFVTIRRFTKLNTYPNDIHGCIGYWDNNFQKLSQSQLYDNMLRVSYDACWTDSRKQYFPPIQFDPLSYLEIDFMMKPIYKIDINTGNIIELNQQFTNKEYGIIIQNKDGSRRATYLPNVFPRISWKKLLESIKGKAGISPIENDFEVFAYKIKQLKTQFISLLTDKIFSYINIYHFSRFLLDNINTTLPLPFQLPYSCKNNILEYNSEDDVRNIATIGDLVKYTSLPGIITKDEIKPIKHIIDLILGTMNYSSQALSFLGHILKNKNSKIKNRYYMKLLMDLKDAEEQFEKPEIIIGLHKAGFMLKSEKEILESLIFISDDTIFKMNWNIQAICSFGIKPSKQLVNILITKINQMIQGIEQIETNYIAVAFEALCFAINNQNRKKLLSLLFILFFELEKRKSCYDVLYTFLDGSARVDITGHINNGLCNLFFL